MPDERLIVDGVSHRSHAAAVRAEASGLSIQNIAGTLCQVDDQGNVTPLIGGTIGGITNLTGDVVAAGPGTVTATIQPGRVTYAKIQNVAANSFLGNNTGAPASVAEISPASAKTLLGLAAIATTGSAADLTGILPAGSFPALTGDVTTVAGSLATTVNIPATRIPFGDVSNHMTTSANLTYVGDALKLQTAGGPVATEMLRLTNNDSNFFHWSQVSSYSVFIGSSVLSSAIMMGGDFRIITLNDNGGKFSVRGTPGNDPTVNGLQSLQIFTNEGDVALCQNTILTNATIGFVTLPNMAGAPTGTPLRNIAGGFGVPHIIDTTDKRAYWHVGGAWHYVSINDGAASGITTLVGDVGASGTGTVTATIQPNVVTLAKMQTIATGSLLGRSTAATGNVEVITVGSGLTLSGGVLTSSSTGGTITALTGDVTASGSGSVAATIAAGAVTTAKLGAAAVTTAKIAAANITTALIANNAVTYALIQTQADQTILGNVSGVTAVPSALTKAQVEAMLQGALATGIVGVTTGTGALTSNALTNTEILFATGANTIGQSNAFTFASNILSVPAVSAVGSGSLTLQSASVGLIINNGPSTADFSGGFNINGVTGSGSVGEALHFGKAADQAITKTGGVLTIGTTDSHFLGILVNNTSVALWDTGGNLLPGTTNTYNLGAPTDIWASLYSRFVLGPSTLISSGGTPGEMLITGGDGTASGITLLTGKNSGGNSYTVGADGRNARVWLNAGGDGNVLIGASAGAVSSVYGAQSCLIVEQATTAPTSAPAKDHVVIWVDGGTGSLKCRTNTATYTLAI